LRTPSRKLSVESQLLLGPNALAELREGFLSRWERRAAEIQDSEKDLQRQLNSDVQRIIDGKRLVLFAEMLEEAQVPN